MLPLDQYHFLLQAYDRLGRHLYGAEWTGQEILQPRLDPPEDVQVQREPLERQIGEVNAREDKIRAIISVTTDETLIAALEHEKGDQFSKRAQLQKDLRQLPKPDENYRRCYDAYARAEKAKAILFDALTSEAIKAQASLGMLIDWPGWGRMRGFRYDLDLSLVILPRTISGKRRAAVLIRKQEFDAWLKTVMPLSAERVVQLEPETRCRAWFLDLARKHPDKCPYPKKSAMRHEARKLFWISGRAFDRVWDELAPRDWKKGGAPAGPRNSIAPKPTKRDDFRKRS